MLKLILPEGTYWQSFQDGLEELKKFPTNYDIFGMRSGLAFDNFADYKENCENMRLGIGLKSEYVPASRLWLIEDEKFVGLFDVRHRLTEALKIEGGHIAYYVVPSARGKGFATAGLKLCCQYVHDILNIEKALVSCNAANIASYKTMKKVMIEFGGKEDSSTIVDNHRSEERRVGKECRL